LKNENFEYFDYEEIYEEETDCRFCGRCRVGLVGIYFLVKFISGIELSPELVGWLNAPISEIKTWHLLLMLWFTAAIAS